jgi:hypothetical protein
LIDIFFFKALYTVGGCSTFRHLDTHRWIRPSRYHPSAIPNRAQWHLQRLEGVHLLNLSAVSISLCHRKANAIGRSSKTVREFLEKNHKDDMTRDESIKLTVKSLLEVVQTGAKNIEISVMESYGKVTVSARNVCSSSPHITFDLRIWTLRK